ncbi:hypothetical protein LL912_18120 [Niabella sp. CC-SYL272]|uniref:hypothetical protein n=1 Tax=Niabella agricola TaxID=2891571 RepID=UPI001F2B7BED|nr:hypothetical protein [Niabella agricola]MCF3110705.1 hypothetical protein [Niabella agricola]
MFDAGLKAVVLQSHASDLAHSYGTKYQIDFPFKKNYKYKIRALFKGEKSSTGPASLPMLGMKLHITKLSPNYTLNCIGPQREYQDMTGREYGGSSFVWSQYLISTTALNVDYQSVNVLGTSANSGNTGDQNIKIQKLEITEEAPAAPVNYAKKIKLLGLDTTEIINTGGYIIAEKDILFSKVF